MDSAGTSASTRAAGPIVSLSERLAAVAIPGVAGALTVSAVAVMGVFSVYTYLAWFASETAHLEGVSITVIYFVFGVCAVASNLLSGWLIERTSAKNEAIFYLMKTTEILSSTYGRQSCVAQRN